MKQHIIEITAINECPHCGIRAKFISDSDAQALNEWLQSNYSETLEDAARGYSEARNGFIWEHGGNHNIIDAELLGGDGDGTRSSKANDVFEFIYVDSEDKTEQACDYCARYM